MSFLKTDVPVFDIILSAISPDVNAGFGKFRQREAERLFFLYACAIILLDRLEFDNKRGYLCFTEKNGTSLVKRLFGMY